MCGETGSGKTTQLPKLLYEMGYSKDGMIAHTQPRKVAARTITHRINQEIREANNINDQSNYNLDIVGYKVRFYDKTYTHTAIKLMTDGILLQEISSDRLLSKYKAIIIDEAHERSLNIDFILGYLKTILNKRPDLKIIITSATIDNQKLSKYFNNAPVINVEGKTYPVDIIYQDLGEENNLNATIYQAIESCYALDSGNVLVFLPGEREIKECVNYLGKTNLRRNEILALFSRQNEAEQNLVFSDNGKQKIIVTTNVAETSLTIPGVRFVIDSGLARVKRYNVRNRVEQLQVEPISKASSKQRSGRAGRTSHGMCIRLFSEEEFNIRPEYTDPEIIRSNLANVILRLIGLKLGDPLTYPFLDLPQNTAYNDGFKTLFQLKALNDDNQITDIGRLLVKIPIDVNLAKILLSGAREFNCLAEVLIIVSFLSISDPREVPFEHQQLARERHQIWVNKKSDLVVILNLWNWYYAELENKKSTKKLIEKCYSQFLSYPRMREWHELHSQLKSVMENIGYNDTKALNINTDDSYQRLHQALLCGFLNNCGQKDSVEDFYIGTNGKKIIIHPSSQITKPKWIVSSSLNQTTKLYARINAYIESHWLLPMTTHLVKYNYSNETWDKKRGEVVAYEHVIFGGLTIAKKKVAFSKINSALAREIFIKQGIVLNELGKNYKFINNNQNIIESLEALEDKLRLAFIIIEDELFDFYNQFIPNDICDIRSFDVWCKNNELKLFINKDELVKKLIADDSHMTLYPDYMIVNNNKLKLQYVFNMDSLDDGVTATIFIDRLLQIEDEAFSYLVPGLIRDKVTFIIKMLPKALRIRINQNNDFITDFLQNSPYKNFNADFVGYLNINYKIDIKISEIEAIKLPKHLVFHFQIFDKNKPLLVGDNLKILKQELVPELNKLIDTYASSYTQRNITIWVDGMEKLLHPISKSLGYLSLKLEEMHVHLVVMSDLDKANIHTRLGFLQLIKNNLSGQIKYLEQKRFSNFTQTAMYLKNIDNSEKLLTDSINFILRMSVNLTTIPSSHDDFERLIKIASQTIIQNTTLFANILFNIAKYYNELCIKLDGHNLESEIEEQLDNLVYSGFLRYTRYHQLEHFPRYIQAIIKRLDKYAIDKSRDSMINKDINELYETWYDYVDKLEQARKPVSREIYDFRYKIEELRVSLFAQELKTQYPVSLKRLWRELESM